MGYTSKQAQGTSNMARGWESKSIEQQQAERAEASKSAGPRLSQAQQKLNRHREGLLLARKRLADQLQAASHAQHRQMLDRAITEIDQQLSSFEKLTGPHTQK
jgi:hypothetical protein